MSLRGLVRFAVGKPDWGKAQRKPPRIVMLGGSVFALWTLVWSRFLYAGDQPASPLSPQSAEFYAAIVGLIVTATALLRSLMDRRGHKAIRKDADLDELVAVVERRLHDDLVRQLDGIRLTLTAMDTQLRANTVTAQSGSEVFRRFMNEYDQDRREMTERVDALRTRVDQQQCEIDRQHERIGEIRAGDRG